MDELIDRLASRVWDSPRFHAQRGELADAWIRREFGLPDPSPPSADTLVQCTQAATILAASENPGHRGAAFGVVACAADLGRADLPGIDGALRIVLTRMGNFPAVNTAASVAAWARLPIRLALSEEVRRELNRVSVGGEQLDLTDFQRSLWSLLESGENVAISAPTSAGKSFVLQAHLRRRFGSPDAGTAVYLVPSRALLTQVADGVARWRKADGREGVSLVTVPFGADVEPKSPAVYVMTQERMQAVLTDHPGFRADLIVCDEAQVVEDGARGVLLQNVIDQLLTRRPEAQIVFAGPNIRNPGVFGPLFGIKLLQELGTKSPSVVQNLIVVNTRHLVEGKVAIARLAGGTTSDLGDVDFGRALPTIRERLVRIAEKFGREKPSIVYANGPADAEGVARGLADVLAPVEASERLQDLAALARSAVHARYDLPSCLARGVGFHYGRMPAIVRRGVEDAFAGGDIGFLVTTSTLMQGVNFPAANLFVCKPKKGGREDLDPAEFWNLAGRAGRLGREFQGNIFLIDYQDWTVRFADQPNDVEVRSSMEATLAVDLDALLACASEDNPPLENDGRMKLEATFARLLSDLMAGGLDATLDRFGLSAADRTRLTAALSAAQARIGLPLSVLKVSPTVSALRQQRLADYLASEVKGGGLKRIAELTPRHPRDEDAYLRLSEIFKVCHRQLLSLNAPKLHARMAAIALRWMRGDSVPEIVDENHRRSGGDDIAKSIRETLNDIEQEIRFRYFRLTNCYLAVFAHVLNTTGHNELAGRLPALPSFLEVGAADRTMISFIAAGISRVTAGVLSARSIDKDMDVATALAWLAAQDLTAALPSRLMREEAARALAAR